MYNNRTFHDLLGVEPKRNPTPPDRRRHSNGQPSRDVTPVYDSDVEVDSDVEEADDPRGTRRHRSEDEDEPREDEEEEEEEGRYSIGSRRQPPTKRRRMGTMADKHTVFTTDDEEDGDENGLLVTNIADSEDDLEDYESDGGASNDGAAKRDKTRSYWLSKGVGMADEGSD